MSSENYGATVAERCVSLIREVAMEFNGVPDECSTVLGIAKYLATSAVFSGYAEKRKKC